MLNLLRTIDRRWIFLAMFLAVAIPILLEARFPEIPTGLAQSTFDEVDTLNEGDPVLLAFDYDPASEGELGPMATAFVRHCCEKKLRMYFLALWPVGPQMIRQTIDGVIKRDFGHLEYGRDYVNLGFKAGNEGVIKVIISDFSELYTTDINGTPLSAIPMMEGMDSVQNFKLVINVSAGYPGTKEWVLYAKTPNPELTLIAGCTGVQAPLLYPYIPQQLPGLLGAIKGAAEYEKLVLEKYGANVPDLDRDGNVIMEDGKPRIPARYLEGRRRMGPQLVAHLLMIALIIVGNVIYLIDRKRGSR
ncbi:MAG: hypothetical protein KDA25_08785 [Phycisphaerales bacterium]|nr:hypothetical protein [Phycisphaerales bacterium]